jgi:hypothetical protein
LAQSTNRLATSANDEHKNNLFIFYNIKLNSFFSKFRYKSRFICQWDMKKSRPPLSLWRGGLSV